MTNSKVNSKIKLYLINGPLGAGKTTTLKELLKQPFLKGARVIENEFASISVDTEQIHSHVEEVKTIAGVCICCSTGDELTDALQDLAASGNQPVIIEATGVANSLIILEKLIVADIFDKYELASAIFALDSLEFNDDAFLSYTDEIKAADLVLLTKTDVADKASVSKIENNLAKIGAKNVQKSVKGVFDYSAITSTSSMFEYFASHSEGFIPHDSDTSYTIINSDDFTATELRIELAWRKLSAKYGLKRMKGNIAGSDGLRFHVEATPGQCLSSDFDGGEMKLVLIGKRAHEVTSEVFKNSLTINAESEVEELLNQYKDYQEVSDKIKVLSRQLAVAKLTKDDVAGLDSDYKDLTLQQQQISDSMTFASPTVWMLYKLLAYKDEPQPILTINDFKVHCSKPGYICTKRFEFLNDYLEKDQRTRLDDKSTYKDNDSLKVAIDSKDIKHLELDDNFMKKWSLHEYHKIDGRTAKWENY